MRSRPMAAASTSAGTSDATWGTPVLAYTALSDGFVAKLDTPTTTLTQRVAAASDDAEEEGPTGTTPNRMWLDSSDIELVSDFDSPSAGVQKVGLRFTGMNIPVGATITDAYIVFRAVAADPGMTNSDATNLTLRGQLIGNAPTFTTTSGNISGRTLTSASAAWTPTAWTTGQDYSSPNLTSVVQEIVDQGTWASGNALAIIITGTGHRASQAYETDPARAAQLVVTYTVSSAPTIANLSGDTLTYSVGSAATVIEQGGNVAISDIDSADFDTGALTVSFAAGGVGAQDVLAIRNQGTGAGQIGVSGANVTYAGTPIGTWAGGSGGSNLVITLNADANSTSTAALIQNITYRNTNATTPTLGARTVRFVLTDGDSGTSANNDTTVNVNPGALGIWANNNTTPEYAHWSGSSFGAQANSQTPAYGRSSRCGRRRRGPRSSRSARTPPASSTARCGTAAPGPRSRSTTSWISPPPGSGASSSPTSSREATRCWSGTTAAPAPPA